MNIDKMTRGEILAAEAALDEIVLAQMASRVRRVMFLVQAYGVKEHVSWDVLNTPPECRSILMQAQKKTGSAVPRRRNWHCPYRRRRFMLRQTNPH